jgi:Cdc6-like AAA superfamily ATPase
VSAEETHGFNSDNVVASESKQSTAALTLVRCPPPSQIFQGRQDILEKMAKYFSADPGQRHIYVLYGLGGSGKTQIALKFLDMMNRCQTPR